MDLRNATIDPGSDTGAIGRKAAQMLHEEIEKRTQLRLPVGGSGQIRIVLEKRSGPHEGFTLRTAAGGVVVQGNDDRGVMFGAGYLLRRALMSRQRLEIEDGLNVTTAPKYAVRGHQLGYRPKTNAYDGWTVPMWDQYIRELAIFGANTIELIPPRSDDAPDSPHFPLPQMDMMVEQSRIANEYGLDVSIWYPAMDADYSNPATVNFALKEWGEVFRKLPRVDAVFVPGGDPGHTRPKYLLALLEKQAANLHRYHPKAQMWVSPQSFDKAWLDEFYALLDAQPSWLAGVVYGPQVRGSIDELRARAPKRYPVRFYPDITHSIHSEFPVPDWDFAFATTEGREVVNPRPLDEAAIFRRYAPHSIGFVTYSEGCNDDVNKFVWSGLGWNPDAHVSDILREYSRFFIGPDLEETFTKGLLALEQNWAGPVMSNRNIAATLVDFQNMEAHATPQQKLSWRFQEALYRANYDAWVQRRLTEETKQESFAVGILASGSPNAPDAAEQILDRDTRTADDSAIRARVFELAEALFQSIHMQLSVPRYQAIALGRGANLDALDFALNDRVWLKNELKRIGALPDGPERQAAIRRIAHWKDAEPGGFYDDLGDPEASPHLLRGEPYAKDPDFLHSPMTGFGAKTPQEGWRVSWYTDAETLGETPLRMQYKGLDKTAQYRVRVVYGGDTKVPIRLTANGRLEIHPFRGRPNPPEPLEFDIPAEATQAGELVLEWTRPPGLGGNGRGVQVAEVWLIRKSG
jgi:hypothetical protein